MRRIAFAVLCSCVLVLLGVPAKAGDYYDTGYHRHRHASNVWYSSSCCYRKVVRHERTVRYSRVEEERPYYRRGYYERPYRPAYYDSPRRYVDYAPRRYDGYDAYDYSGYAAYADSCSRRRVPLADGRGGWVWGMKLSCY